MPRAKHEACGTGEIFGDRLREDHRYSMGDSMGGEVLGHALGRANACADACADACAIGKGRDRMNAMDPINWFH